MAAKIVKSDTRELRVDNNHMKIISLAPEVL